VIADSSTSGKRSSVGDPEAGADADADADVAAGVATADAAVGAVDSAAFTKLGFAETATHSESIGKSLSVRMIISRSRSVELESSRRHCNKSASMRVDKNALD